MKELGKVLLQRQNKTIYLSKDEKSLIKVFNHNLVKKSEVLQEGVGEENESRSCTCKRRYSL